MPKKSINFEVTGTTKSDNLAGSQATIGWRNRNAFRAGELLSVNLTGYFLCAQIFAPQMRKAGRGSSAPAVTARAKMLGVKRVMLGAEHKLAPWERLRQELGVAAEDCAHIGDDLPDLPLLRRCGLALTVPHAPELVKRHAHYVTDEVREVVERNRSHLVSKPKNERCIRTDDRPGERQNRSLVRPERYT